MSELTDSLRAMADHEDLPIGRRAAAVVERLARELVEERRLVTKGIAAVQELIEINIKLERELLEARGEIAYLREPANSVEAPAADEIERLTRELAEAKAEKEPAHVTLKMLADEMKKTRTAAIEEAAKVAETYDPELADPDVYTEQAIAAAIRALVKP